MKRTGLKESNKVPDLRVEHRAVVVDEASG